MDEGNRQSVRFGAFELDRHSGELRRKGVKVHVQEKPLRILEALIDQPGVLITREDLQRRLWSTDTFVDFDNGLNNAVNRLRLALDDDAVTPRFVETVGRRGYRFIAAVSACATADRSANRPTGAAQRARGTAMRLVVLPLRVLRADPETDFLAFSLADAVTAALSGLEALAVRSSVAAAKFGAVAPNLVAIARALDVNLVLAGSLVRDGDTLRISTQLVQVPDGSLVWTHTSEATLEQIFRVQDGLVRRIVESLALPLSIREQDALAHDVPAGGRGFASYLRANRLSEDPKTLDRARDLYLDAIREDGNYAPAWARLARVYRFMAKFGLGASEEHTRLAEQAARRALALNPELSFAHFVHAQLELESGRVRAALTRLFDRAGQHRRDPHLFAALVQACRYGGLLDASIAADRRARELDPNIRTSVAYTWWMAGDLERALEQAQRIGEMGLGLLLIATERRAEARAWCEQAERRYAGFDVSLAYVRALAAFVAGDRTRSVEAADAVHRRSGFCDPEGIYYIAVVMMWNGETTRALEVLSCAVSRGFASLAALDIDSVWQPIRMQPEFASLRDEVGRRYREIAADFEVSGAGRHL